MPPKIVIFLACLLGLVPGCLKQGGADRKPPEVASERNRRDSGNAAASIVFVRDGIWIAGADGSSQRKIADGDDPEISPDGTRIACTLHGGGGQRFIAIAATR